jgi:putative flippase GtrA
MVSKQKLPAFLYQMFSELLVKIIRFGIVGASGTVVDFSCTYLFKERIKVHKYAANGVGFLAGASSNYIFNRIWTFQSQNPDILHEYLTFLALASVGLLINTTLLYLFETKLKVSFYKAKVLAILGTMFWNFLSNYFFNFK